jgi:hypothetical protein
MDVGVPAWLDVILVVIVQAVFLFLVLSLVGRNNNAGQMIGLAAGLVTLIAIFGLVSEARLPLTIVVDLAFAIFIWRLFRKYDTKVIIAYEE